MHQEICAILSVQFASSLISSLPDRHAAMSHRHARYCTPPSASAHFSSAAYWGSNNRKQPHDTTSIHKYNTVQSDWVELGTHSIATQRCLEQGRRARA